MNKDLLKKIGFGALIVLSIAMTLFGIASMARERGFNDGHKQGFQDGFKTGTMVGRDTMACAWIYNDWLGADDPNLPALMERCAYCMFNATENNLNASLEECARQQLTWSDLK